MATTRSKGVPIGGGGQRGGAGGGADSFLDGTGCCGVRVRRQCRVRGLRSCVAGCRCQSAVIEV